MNLILCGFPGSGKTTIGKRVSQRLRYTFIDTDPLIEKAFTEHNGDTLSCREIFTIKGESDFLRIEK